MPHEDFSNHQWNKHESGLFFIKIQDFSDFHCCKGPTYESCEVTDKNIENVYDENFNKIFNDDFSKHNHRKHEGDSDETIVLEVFGDFKQGEKNLVFCQKAEWNAASNVYKKQIGKNTNKKIIAEWSNSMIS